MQMMRWTTIPGRSCGWKWLNRQNKISTLPCEMIILGISGIIYFYTVILETVTYLSNAWCVFYWWFLFNLGEHNIFGRKIHVVILVVFLHAIPWWYICENGYFFRSLFYMVDMLHTLLTRTGTVSTVLHMFHRQINHLKGDYGTFLPDFPPQVRYIFYYVNLVIRDAYSFALR